MKQVLFVILIALTLLSCRSEEKGIDAAARVNDQYLYEADLEEVLPEALSGEDSLLFRNNYIKSWATKELLLEKARINVEDQNEEIEELVKNYRQELLIDKYKKAVLQQELDTMITETDIDSYYEKNKAVYKLNENLIQLRYVHLGSELNDKKELIKMFKSFETEDREELIKRELEFNSYNFNDSIWLSASDVEKKLAFLKEEKKLKKNQFIQKEDSIGVYLLTIKDLRFRNDIAPREYVEPTIRQMILHKRKLQLMNEIEKTLMTDAINNKKFEQY